MENPDILIGLDLSVASREVIEILIEDASGPDVFDEIARANLSRQDILELLFHYPDTPEQIKTYISGILQLPAKPAVKIVTEKKPREARPQNLLQKIQSLSVGERLQLALKGGREIRSILVKDSNKQVMLSVLENQKITDSEVEMIARSRSVPEDALRLISKNREWLKNYAITFALVTNPKTPPGISVTLISGLKIKDLVLLDKNKNVPELIRSSAKRLLTVRKPR
ncbi:MAG: hypothetical protein A2Z47_08610 [Thermodesulfovibrio sp. RBG_19FT_COMBO_42_12]|nr:MAG: hypothetical protein A2Z47_08610 [Thermodesulfovibrio sp. RBG_19FT_COMBO_42_12]